MTYSLFAHVGLIGPDAKAVFFYQKEGNIMGVECRKYTNLRKQKEREDCMATPKRILVDASEVVEFKEMLEKVWRRTMELKTIKIYEDAQDIHRESILEDQKRLQDEMARIKGFIGEYKEENAGTAELDLTRLQDELSSIEDILALNKIVEEIDGKIERLIHEILRDDFIGYVYSEDKETFEFNMLSEFFKDSLLFLKVSDFDFATIKPGKFMMSPVRGGGTRRYKVSIPKAFQIMKTEVTQYQWFSVMGDNPSDFDKKQYCEDDYIVLPVEDGEVGLCPFHPVERVSWDRVQEFIGKLNERDGRTGCIGTPKSSPGCYRLPTIAEWEFAARADSKTDYYFGNNPKLLSEYAWYRGNSNGTHAVGGKDPNDNDLYDVMGNVWEWVWTESGESRHTHRVFRGGSWSTHARYLKLTDRTQGGPAGQMGYHVGFRLVKTL